MEAFTSASLPGYESPSKVTVEPGATLAVRAGAVTGEWVTSEIDALQNNAIFNSGSFLAIDTTGGDFSYDSIIGGSLGIAKLGTNTLTLTGNNTFTGPVNFNGGLIKAASLNNLGNGTKLNFNGGGLQFDGVFDPSVRTMTFQAGGATLDTQANNITLANAIGNGGSGGLTKKGSGILTLTGNNTFTGPVNFNGGLIKAASLNNLGNGTALNFNGGGLQFDGVYDPSARTMTFQAGGATLDTQANDITLANSIGNGDIGGLTKKGTGNLILSGANTYSGDTKINDGSITLANVNALQNSTLDYNSYGGTLSFGTLTTAILGGLKGSQYLSLTNSNSDAVAIQIGYNGQSTDYSGSLSGAGSLTKTGTGTFTLMDNSSFTGPVNFNGGLIKAASLNNLGNGAELNFNGGGLQFDGVYDPSVRTMTFQAGGATIDTQANNITLANAIGNGGSGGFTKKGTGILTLTGNNTFIGPVNFNGGLIKAAALNNLGNSSSTLIFNGGGLQFDGVYDPSIRTMTFQAGSATLDTQANNITLNNAIGNGGTGGLTKQSAGTLEIAGGIDLSGTSLIDIQSGTAVFKTVDMIKADLDINTAASAIFEVAGGVHEIGKITGSGTTQIDSGAVLAVDKFPQDTLNIASGGKLVIHPTSGGPLALSDNLKPVPNPPLSPSWASV